MTVAIIIVTWNVRDLALEAVRTAREDLARNGPEGQIWVVDNASTDGTVEAIRARFPDVQVIASTENLGFAAGNNLALRMLGFGQTATADLPEAVFLLNPDTLVQDRAIRTLYEALFAAPTHGLVGARLTYGDGSFQHSAFAFPGVLQTAFDLLPLPPRLYNTRLNGRYPRQLYERGEPFRVDFVLGATMMLRCEVIQQVGMFDEQFFMYCEEIDWAMRIQRAGWQVLCVPGAQVIHLEGRSTSQVRPQSYLNLWRSRFQLYRKHYSPLKVAAIRAVVRLGMSRRLRQLAQDRALDAAQRVALAEAYRAIAAL
ncbi:MAG: glycosyltransferase family 2 protein [Anaerolineae bacterium]|nr:glycosyltransferase family 2 protein [Anaerolineae bacterium]